MTSMHQLEEIRAEEDADGLYVLWVCECGERGRGKSQQTAHTGWRTHVVKSDRVRCRIVSSSS